MGPISTCSSSGSTRASGQARPATTSPDLEIGSGKAIHLCGLTPALLSPDRQHELLAYRLGVTNLVNRATARADELADEQLRAGVGPLSAKVERFRPRKVAYLGVSTYRVAFGKPQASVGRQPRAIGASEVWVLPNPSGLNAHYDLPGLAAAYAELLEGRPASAPDRSPAA